MDNFYKGGTSTGRCTRKSLVWGRYNVGTGGDLGVRKGRTRSTTPFPTSQRYPPNGHGPDLHHVQARWVWSDRPRVCLLVSFRPFIPTRHLGLSFPRLKTIPVSIDRDDVKNFYRKLKTPWCRMMIQRLQLLNKTTSKTLIRRTK